MSREYASRPMLPMKRMFNSHESPNIAKGLMMFDHAAAAAAAACPLYCCTAWRLWSMKQPCAIAAAGVVGNSVELGQWLHGFYTCPVSLRCIMDSVIPAYYPLKNPSWHACCELSDEVHSMWLQLEHVNNIVSTGCCK